MSKTVKISLGDKVIDGKSKVQAEIKGGELCITGLPDNDVLEYVAVSKDRKYFVVHRPAKNWWYGRYKFRLHIGLEADLREAQVKNVSTLGDCGSTHIEYSLNGILGRIRFPAESKRGEEAWNSYDSGKEPLERLL